MGEHQPTNAFGCPVMWGPGPWYKQHVCNARTINPNHAGDHHCACGATHPAASLRQRCGMSTSEQPSEGGQGTVPRQYKQAWDYLDSFLDDVSHEVPDSVAEKVLDARNEARRILGDNDLPDTSDVADVRPIWWRERVSDLLGWLRLYRWQGWWDAGSDAAASARWRHDACTGMDVIMRGCGIEMPDIAHYEHCPVHPLDSPPAASPAAPSPETEGPK